MKKIHWSLLLLVIVLFSFTGCQNTKPIIPIRVTDKPIEPLSTTDYTVDVTRKSPPLTVTISSTNSVTVSKVLDKTATPVPSLTPYWTTLTPEATVNIPTAIASVEEFLKANGGCQLPCWWGIKPGKTRFSEIVSALAPMSVDMAVKQYVDGTIIEGEFLFPTSAEFSFSSFIKQRYEVNNGIVERIEVTFGNGVVFPINELLDRYGVPDEIWVNGLIDPSSNHPFSIYLYYARIGIIAHYSLDGHDTGKKFRLCPWGMNPLLLLWEPEKEAKFLEFARETRTFNYLKEEKYIHSLSESTGMDTTTFYEKFRREDGGCFETQKSLWPSR